MTPEEISGAKLPRTIVGGVNRKAVQEFLKRVAWEYAEATHKAKEHKEAQNPLTQRVAELEGQLRSLQAELDGRKDPTEIAQTLLGVARQSAQQLRENARTEAEAVLRKARSRAQEIEEDAVHRAQTSSEDLERLIALRRRVRDEVQAALETLAATDAEGEEQQPRAASHAQPKASHAELEALRQKARELEAQVKSLQAQLEDRQDPELANSLLTAARQSAEDMRETARREAEALLADATSRAQAIAEEARQRSQSADEEMSRLAELRRHVFDEVRGALDAVSGIGEVAVTAEPPSGPDNHPLETLAE